MKSLTSTLAGIGAAVTLAATLEMTGLSQHQHNVNKAEAEFYLKHGIKSLFPSPELSGDIGRYVIADGIIPIIFGLLVGRGLYKKYGEQK